MVYVQAVPVGANEVDLNQVVAYNVRAARELRGWTQDDVAERLEPYLGQRLAQASVSAIERAWDSERRREFDAQELLVFSLVFDLPMVWFLLPPPGDRRMMRSTTRPVNELYAHLLGMPHQLEPLYARLRELGIADPDATDEAFQLLTGGKTAQHEWGYRERRKELLLALLDQHADAFDTAVEDLGRVVDRLRLEYDDSGRSDRFEELVAVLTRDPGSSPYAEIARRLGTTEGNIRVAVHRLRRRYGLLLREEIAATVGDAAQVDDEIQALFVALAG